MCVSQNKKISCVWEKQPWNCPACTYLNEDPAFRAACEICNTPRPSADAAAVGTGTGTGGGGGEHRHDDWDDNEVLKSCGGGGGGSSGRGGIPTTASATMSSFSPAVPPAVAAGGGPTAFASSVAAGTAGAVAPPPQIEACLPSGFSVGGGGEAGGLPVGGIEVDDNEVDGILGGVSPGGGAFPVVSGADQAASGHCDSATAASAAALGGSWEAGDEWQGFGSGSFGQESPANCSPRRPAKAFEFSFGNSEAGGGGGGVGDGAGDGNDGRGVDNVEFGREGCAP